MTTAGLRQSRPAAPAVPGVPGRHGTGLALSLVAAVVAYVAGIGTGRCLGAKLAAFVAMAEVLFAWLLLGQAPTAAQLAGGALFLAGIIAVRTGELGG